MRLAAVVSLGLVIGGSAACGGGQHTTTTEQTSNASGGPSASPSPAPTSATIPIVPLRLHGHTQTGDHVGELRADGTLVLDGHEVARFQGNQVLSPTGTVLLELTPEGRLQVPGQPASVQLTDAGELVGNDERIVVNADGSIDDVRSSGAPDRAPFGFDSVPADARRTAAVVVAVMLLPSGGTAEPSPSAASAAVASAEPASVAPATDATASAAPAAHPAHPSRTHRHGHH